MIEMGRTRVLCNATIEEIVPRWMINQARSGGWVTAEYAMLPRATQERSRRETQPSSRTQEIRRLVGRSLRAGLDLEKLGQRTITIDCDVLQADGGTRTAAITGGYVAMVLAVWRLIAQGLVPETVLLPAIAAVSVGIVDGEPLLDLCYSEDSRAAVDFNVVMNGAGLYVEMQGTAEGNAFSRQELNALLDLAHHGIDQLFQAQKGVLRAGY